MEEKKGRPVRRNAGTFDAVGSVFSVPWWILYSSLGVQRLGLFLLNLKPPRAEVLLDLGPGVRKGPLK